ncbi:MAG: ankyrin repeat domain-containing protein, partial [Synergistaceae bacterium]|nr:ankyrin repeat domain-containing protein [Synergistaceae bacterium]
VKALIQAGADINAKDNLGSTALMSARNAEIVKALIQAGADDLTDNEGKTALICAAESEYSNPETVNALIDAGSYVKHRDNLGKTALDYARNNYRLEGTDALKRLEELSR